MFKKMIGNKKLIADVILISSLLIIALSVFLILFFTREDGAWVTATVDGVVVGEYPLSRDAEILLNGGTNTLVIEGGAAYLSHSDCPDKTCQRGSGVFGKPISYVGERIVCLPNRVMIEVRGGGEEVLGG